MLVLRENHSHFTIPKSDRNPCGLKVREYSDRLLGLDLQFHNQEQEGPRFVHQRCAIVNVQFVRAAA